MNKSNYYEVNVSEFQQTILPPSMGLQTTVYGYGGLAKDALTGKSLGYVRNSPGPSFEAQRAVPVQVKFTNDLTAPHMFPIDTSIMWANPGNPGETGSVLISTAVRSSLPPTAAPMPGKHVWRRPWNPVLHRRTGCSQCGDLHVPQLPGGGHTIRSPTTPSA